MDTRVDHLEAKMGSLDAKLETKFASLDARLDSRASKLDTKVGSVETRFDAKLDNRFAWLLSLYLTSTAAILGAMARGFGWL